MVGAPHSGTAALWHRNGLDLIYDAAAAGIAGAGGAAGALYGYCDLAPTLRRLAAQRRARERRDGLAAAE